MHFKSAFGRPERYERLRRVGKPRLRGIQSAKNPFTVRSLQTISEEVEVPNGEPKGSGESSGPATWLGPKLFVLTSKESS